MSALVYKVKGLHRKPKAHKLTLRARLKTILFQLPAAHIGGLAAVGAYFFITQILHGQSTTIDIGSWHWGITAPDVKGTWDHLMDASPANGGVLNVMTVNGWTVARHLIRPLYEGIFGGLLAVFVVANPYKVKLKERPGLFTRLEIKSKIIPTNYSPVTVLQIVLLPLMITLFSLPGVGLGYGVDQLLHWILHTSSLSPAISAHPSVVDKFYSLSFDAKVIGLFGAIFFARRPAKPVFYFILRWFAMRRALNSKPTHWYHTPVFRMLVADYALLTRHELREKVGNHNRLVHLSVPLMMLGIIGMAGLGYWVLRFVAS